MFNSVPQGGGYHRREGPGMEPELVDFYFYQHDPRMEVRWRAAMRTVPIVGDHVTLPGEAFTQLGKRLFRRNVVKKYGAGFVVCKREKYFTTGCGEDWRITLDLADPRHKYG